MPWSIFTQGGGQGAAVTWAEDLLKDIGAPVTEGNKQFIYDWEVSEGGGGKFNPLNQGPVPGHSDLTTTGQQYGGGAADFRSWGAGLAGARDYLNMPAYSGVREALRRNDPVGARAALIQSPWAASHYGYGSAFSDTPLPGRASALSPAGGSSRIGGNAGQRGDGSLWNIVKAAWSGVSQTNETAAAIDAATLAPSGVSSVAQGLLTVAAPITKAVDAIDWLFHPDHWIRIFAGIGGSVFMLMGVWNLSHVGGQASTVTVAGSTVPTSAGGTLALPIGILEVGLGGVLLFVAFHNLPSSVKTFPDFLSHLRDEVQKAPTKAPEPAAA
jgi:uncharacterized membrane protein (DUF2068 family)